MKAGQRLILGRTNAVEKAAAFLREMAERLTDRRVEVIVLPMSRYDVADYLAISIESVSRALTGLKRSGAIRFSGKRRVWIVDRGALEDGDNAVAKAPRTHGMLRAR